MTTYGISMMRDEADIVRRVAEHMQTQVDHIIVLDDGSTDGTAEILDELGVQVVTREERGYYQSRVMTGLAQMAGDQGAEWIVPFDADEVWSTPEGQPINQTLESLAPEYSVAEAVLYDYVCSTDDDPKEPDPLKRIRWRRTTPLKLPKVACRYDPSLVVNAGNHSASYRFAPLIIPGLLTVRHFPYRSPEHFVAKVRKGAAAYALTNLPPTTGAHWRGYGRMIDENGEGAAREHFERWFLTEPGAESVVFDPIP